MNLDWMDSALCAQTGPEVFFPEGSGHSYRTAKTVCARCPVKAACEAHAQNLERGLSHPYRHGAWGGQAPRTRAKTSTTSSAVEARDAEIRRLAAARWGNRAIARELHCGERTVIRVLKAAP